MVKHLLFKYRELIKYSFWGIFTMAANIGVYYLCFDELQMSNALSTIFAWASAVLVAFVTNKLFVFNSRNTGLKETLREMGSFFGFRFVSEIFDLGIMVFAVDIMQWNSLAWKLLANVIVIALNYIFSKFIIFREEPEVNHKGI